ncbi:MAG: amidohydrolase family protein [Verrucomicrobia bacterium]|nr:amidohydrolase family protein [Verrucomicrobiota bacterium]
MKIWDLHCHLSGAPLTETTPEARLAHLLAAADRMGIERVCVFMGMSWAYEPPAERIRVENDAVLRAIEKYPDRAFGFVYLNPKHLDASMAELERCVARGPMVGVKLWVAQRCSAAELDPIVRRAAELKALIFQHTWFKITGNLPGESTPEDFAELASRHPDVPLVCGHTGGDWERGILAIRHLKNTYADLAGGDPTAGLTEMAVRELGAERVLYGSDAPGRSFASQLAKVHGAAIPATAKQLILSENLKRLLTPILTAKGIKV